MSLTWLQDVRWFFPEDFYPVFPGMVPARTWWRAGPVVQARSLLRGDWHGQWQLHYSLVCLQSPTCTATLTAVCCCFLYPPWPICCAKQAGVTGEQEEEPRHSTMLQWGEERMLLGQAWSSPCSSGGKPHGATVLQPPARNCHSSHIFWASAPLLPDSMSNMEG